jgi:hypothetical protein
MTQTLPRDITSYDLLKTFAVVIMVIDHTGYYFFPDDLWWRSVGRIGFPVWFFLIGHARGRDVSFKLMAAAFILLAGNIVAGLAVFPLNALFTIIFIRMVLDAVMRFSSQSPPRLWGLSAVLLAIALPSALLSEYGTIGLITAMFGYLVRRAEYESGKMHERPYMIFSILGFVALQHLFFAFTPAQAIVMAAGAGMVFILLSKFRARTYPRLSVMLPGPIGSFCRFCGRRTLEIYSAHLLAFKALALLLGLEGYGLFAWRWF